MIFVDPRDGSDTLVAPLRKMGLEVDDQAQLPAGDLYFVGRGEKGAPVNVGIEYKTVSDLITSLTTQRLQGHQLLEMKGAAEGERPYYDHAYLLIQGELIYNKAGMLMRRSGVKSFKPLGMTHDELLKRLTVLHLRGGLNWARFDTQDECVRWVSAVYHTWTDRDLDEHKSHLGIYVPPTLIKPTVFEETVSRWPGVGMKYAKAASKVFVKFDEKGKAKPSIRVAVNASVDRWAGLETVDEKTGKKRRLGMSHAAKIMDALQ